MQRTAKGPIVGPAPAGGGSVPLDADSDADALALPAADQFEVDGPAEAGLGLGPPQLFTRSLFAVDRDDDVEGPQPGALGLAALDTECDASSRRGS